MSKISVSPLKGQGNFKKIEVATKNWNLQTRTEINKLYSKALDAESDVYLFEAGYKILEMATTFTEEDIFNLSQEEISAIAFRLVDEINKKKS